MRVDAARVSKRVLAALRTESLARRQTRRGSGTPPDQHRVSQLTAHESGPRGSKGQHGPIQLRTAVLDSTDPVGHQAYPNVMGHHPILGGEWTGVA